MDRQRQHPMQTAYDFQQPPSQSTVEFTNPFASMRNNSVSASYGGPIPTTAAGMASNRHMSSPSLMANPNDYTSAEIMKFASTSPYGPDISMSGSSAPSPTASASYPMPNFAIHALDFPQNRSTYLNSNNDRRMSQPAIPNSMFLGSPVEAPRPRQNSLMEWPSNNNSTRNLTQPPRSSGDSHFSDALDSARGMVAMSQAPRQHRHDYYAGHSASSSVSSNNSYTHYYNGGSIDSSATDYSDGTGYTVEASAPRTLPRPHGFVGSVGIPQQAQMMGTFSSKVTSSTQKKHKCKICGKRFTRPSSLTTHTYSHTGEKPHQCEVDGCGRKFSVVSNLRRHKKVHDRKSH